MFKYNDAQKGAPKVGFGGGNALPPGKTILRLEVSKPGTSQNLKAGTAGQWMVISEWTVLSVSRRDYDVDKGYRDWKGSIVTAEANDRRSYVIKGQHAGASGDLNMLVALLHGIDGYSQAALRAAGLVANDSTAVEADRVAGEFNKLIDFALSEKNPFLGTILECEVKPVESTGPQGSRTFMRHQFTFVSEPAVVAANAEIRAAAGLK